MEAAEIVKSDASDREKKAAMRYIIDKDVWLSDYALKSESRMRDFARKYPEKMVDVESVFAIVGVKFSFLVARCRRNV